MVEGSWYETPGSPRIPFDLNKCLSFPGLFQLHEACTSLSRLCFDMLLLFELFVGRHRQGRLVSWVEKARQDCIRRLLKITERERNRELLLSTKKLQEFGASPFPYIVPVIPRSLLGELIKGVNILFLLTF